MSRTGRIGRQRGMALCRRGAVLLAAAATACVPPPRPAAYPTGYPAAYAPPGEAAPQAVSAGAPEVTRLMAMPGEAAGVTSPTVVTRIVFPEQVLFDFDSDAPRPEAAEILARLAADIGQDAPGTQVTVLGHTDAVGSEAYNYALSARRAQGVLQALIGRGVDPGQLSLVAVGKAQPVASNATAEGRARNRRVEVLVSADLAANLAIVRRQPVAAARGGGAAHLAVLRPGGHGEADLQALDDVEVQAVGAAPPPRLRAAPMPRLAVPAPPPRIELNRPRDVERAPLGPAMSY